MKSLKTVILGRKNVACRALWNVVWIFLFRPSPRILHGWRVFLLRLFGAKIGSDVRVYQSAKIWAPWNLVMANSSCLGDFVDCYSVDRITIGEGAVVSQYCFLCSATHDARYSDLPLQSAPIEIGDLAWVTADVFVGPGITIGKGSVINARSTVVGDIPEWVIASGNPAVPKKRREYVDRNVQLQH